ncbi:hypothetical protein EDD27_3595 [Nonomuraea polychroma]|uniref:Uncharacterized protein n=1 Tax=Nonomuraea polychroma TaxID=46176 RepID=A0A438M5J5_9ACTN|nr:hypothetical protein EDD27_3595 [Nonomuraea polychroma]
MPMSGSLLCRVIADGESGVTSHLCWPFRDYRCTSRFGEIAAAVNQPLSRQRADQLTKRDDFPQPLADLAAGKIWSAAAVRRWLATWERKSGRPRVSG